MPEGIRATVEFPPPAACSIARISGEADAVVDSVWRSVSTDGAASVTEFLIEADEPPAGARHVMSIGDRHLLRIAHDGAASCPCECLGRFGCAVQRYFARSGRLRIVFNAADFEELQAVVAALRERFPDLDVRRLVRDPGPGTSGDPVYVDRGKLTGRQLEVLQTAYRMGYFDRPRGANGTEVAAELDIDPSTFSEHLASAQRKLFADVLEDGA